MKPHATGLRPAWPWALALALGTGSGLLQARPQACCTALAASGWPVAQVQSVDSGPPILTAPTGIDSARTPAQEAEWTRLSRLAGPNCSHDAAGASSARAQAQAAWMIGLLYLHGTGIPADPSLARQCFMQAWRQGEPLASAGLAWCAIEGCGLPPQPELARLWLQRLEPVAPARALYLRWWLTNLLAPLPPLQAGQNPVSALSVQPQWLEQAAQRGDTQARIEMGLLQASLLQWREALQWFDLAAQASATARLNAQRVRQQLQHQQDALLLDSDMGQADPDVLYRQARRYHQGDGVPANYAQALMLYQRAAARSSGPAQRMLNLIYSRPSPQGGVDIGWMQQLAQADVTGPQVRWSAAPVSRGLARDPTALFDYVPDLWKPTP